jgi:hypothetical protein
VTCRAESVASADAGKAAKIIDRVIPEFFLARADWVIGFPTALQREGANTSLFGRAA